MKRFEFHEHTADIIVKGCGDTLEEAFAGAADGLFAVITDIALIEPRRRIEIAVESSDREGLLVAFLSELIVRHEVDRIVARDFTVTFVGETGLRAVGMGEAFDESRHEFGMHVKAVSYHMIEVVDRGGDGESYVQVVVDV